MVAPRYWCNACRENVTAFTAWHPDEPTGVLHCDQCGRSLHLSWRFDSWCAESGETCTDCLDVEQAVPATVKLAYGGGTNVHPATDYFCERHAAARATLPPSPDTGD